MMMTGGSLFLRNLLSHTFPVVMPRYHKVWSGNFIGSPKLIISIGKPPKDAVCPKGMVHDSKTCFSRFQIVIMMYVCNYRHLYLSSRFCYAVLMYVATHAVSDTMQPLLLSVSNGCCGGCHGRDLLYWGQLLAFWEVFTWRSKHKRRFWRFAMMKVSPEELHMTNINTHHHYDYKSLVWLNVISMIMYHS